MDPDIPRLRRFLSEKDDSPRLPIPARYELRDLIGEGATSMVYRAWDRELNRFVAVKILREALAHQDAVRKRFEREARAAAQVSHPNAIALHDVGAADGVLYLVMELVDGHPLSDLLSRRKGDAREMVTLLRKVCGAIAAAHERGIVHRDLKPANILVTAAGEPKVGDFGLAQIAGDEAGLTRTGTVMGTPLYMAPEQVRGRSAMIGPRTDVYALGVILYEALTGRPPHTGESVTEIYGRIVNDEPDPPRRVNAGVPRDLEVVALKALEKDPAARYASVAELSDDLGRWLAGDPIRAKPPHTVVRALRWMGRRPAFTSGATAIVLMLIAWMIWSQRERVMNRSDLMSRAQMALVQGNFEEARECCRQVLRADPADRAARSVLESIEDQIRHRDDDEREAAKMVELARPAIDDVRRHYLYEENADYDGVLIRVAEARSQLEKAAVKAPRLPVIPHLLGSAWEILGWNDKAEECWRKAIAIDPKFSPSRYRLGRLKLTRAFISTFLHPEDGRPAKLAEEGMAEVEAALAAGAALDEPLQRETALAMVAYCRKDFDAVRRLSAEAVAKVGEKPGVEELLWLEGLTLAGDERRRALDAAIRIRPRFPLALLMRAVDETNAGQWKEAEADCGAALKIDPRFAWALAQRAVALKHGGRGAEAIADLDTALAVDETMSVARSARGVMRFDLGDVEGGLKDLEETLRRDPAHAPAYLYRGVIREKQGKRKEARVDYDEAVRLGPGNPSAWLARAGLRSEEGDRDGAVADYGRAIDLEPMLLKARLNRAVLLRDRGDVAGAIADYDVVIRIDSRSWVALVNRGVLRLKRNDADGGLADFEQALPLIPADRPERRSCEESVRQLRGRPRVH